MPVSYYNQLKTQLLADATAKKAALDSRLEAYTQASFDTSGNVSYKDPSKLGTRDVQYDTDTRGIKASGESSGTLRSGQQARGLATNLASYKADVIGAKNQLTADKAVVDSEATTELAKYQATYGTGSSENTQTKKEEVPGAAPITPVPTFKPDASKSTAGLSQSRIASEYKVPAKTKIPKKTVTPKRIGGY